MKKTVFWSVLAMLAMLVRGDDKALPILKDVAIGDSFFRLEVAATPAARAHGLMDRDSADVELDSGMLFVFPVTKELAFWMCRTRLDLDILYLDAKGTVVDIQTMAAETPRKPGETQTDYEERLPRYPSKAPAQYAIELKAGTAAAVGVREGDQIALDLPALDRLVAKERDDEADGENTTIP